MALKFLNSNPCNLHRTDLHEKINEDTELKKNSLNATLFQMSDITGEIPIPKI